MARFKITKEVQARLDDVFELFSDIPKTAERVGGVERVEVLTEGPVRAGTRWRETRIIFKREATEELEITSLEPNKSYAVEGESCGIRHHTEFRFTGRGDRTLVEVEFTSRPLTLWAKMTSPLAWLMMGAAKRCVDQDLEDLKAFIEAGGDNHLCVETES
ncbi:MAG: SRPBCC family protein [Planctomycetes bacterium]|nr:SRPBCC family protein [Planctomycetota bacterium]MBL7044428.1 SRPBCC family protein [Pirellulaceae bacterium]